MKASDLDDVVTRIHDASAIAATASKSLSDLAENWAAGIVKSSREMAITAAKTSAKLDGLKRRLELLETEVAALGADDDDEG